MSVKILQCQTCGDTYEDPRERKNCELCRSIANERTARYQRSPRGQETRKAYTEKPSVKKAASERTLKYLSSEKGRQKTEERKSSVEGRAYARLCSQRYRARKKGATVGIVTAVGLRGKLAMYGWKCWICKVAPWREWDHVKPLNRGGAHMLANLRPACTHCNRSKGDRWPFVPDRPPLL